MQTEYWRLDLEKVFLDGTVEISLPIGEPLEIPSYREAPFYYDAEGNMLLPESGVMTFKLDTKGIQNEVITEYPNVPTENDTMSAKVAEVCFTPMKTYIRIEYAVKDEVYAAFLAENGVDTLDANGEWKYQYRPMDVVSGWLYSLSLVDGKGVPLFPDWNAMESCGDEGAEFGYPCIEHIPNELYMAPVVEGTADMTQAIKIR